MSSRPTKQTAPGAVDPADLPYRPCVGILLLNTADRVFVGRRIDTPGAWQMPQGGIDANEPPAVAAQRELAEEIGTERAEILAESRQWLTYDLPPHLIGKAWKGRYRGQQQKWFAFRFTGNDADIRLNTGHPEFSDWQWVSPDDLVRLIVPFKREVYAAVVEEFRPLWDR
ncbi:MAG: RNA pyrophosphohydrolase [Alphaproteobacteria bacterium]|nr:RNA pyrophosphohydrolase [Alphaproteobacteria bacterium]